MSLFTQIFCEAPKLCDMSFEAAPIADDFANFYNNQALSWELKNFALKRRKKRRKCHQAYNTRVCWRSCRMSRDLHINID